MASGDALSIGMLDRHCVGQGARPTVCLSSASRTTSARCRSRLAGASPYMAWHSDRKSGGGEGLYGVKAGVCSDPENIYKIGSLEFPLALDKRNDWHYL
jgi:hypothetical protein